MSTQTPTSNDHQQPNTEPEKSKIHIEESSKVDPQVESSAEKDITINKLRAQNEKLRTQLKELSAKLTETLDKVKLKKSTEKINPQDFRDDTLKKELENANKQIVGYQKEIEKFKYRLQATHTEQKVTQLENLLAEKDRVITELTSEKRNVEKIKRDQEKHIGILQNDRDYNTRLNLYAEEVKGLKEKIKDLQKAQQQEERTAKKQQEYLINLEQKYREVCEKAGVSSSLNVARAEDNNRSKQLQKLPGSQSLQQQQSPSNNRGSNTQLRKVATKSAKMRGEGSVEDDDADEEKLDMTEENFKKMTKTIKILKNAKISLERKYKGDIDQLNSKLKELEYDNKELAAKLKEKEKEANITNFKYNEIKRIVKHNQLNPIVEKPDSQKLNIETTKSVDLSKAIEISKARSDTPKAFEKNKAQNNVRRPEQAKKQDGSKSDLNNSKLSQGKNPIELQKEVEKKKLSNSVLEDDSQILKPNDKDETHLVEHLQKDEPELKEKIIQKEEPKIEKQVENTTKSQVRREVKGRYDSTLEEFDDEKIPQGKRLNQITFWYDDNQIYGLKALYTLADGSDVAGNEHLKVADKTKLKSSSIEIGSDDHISHVTGKYKHSVGYLKIVMANGEIHEFGNSEGANTEHEFVFDIEVKECPISIFGALDKIEEENEDLALAYVGFMIEKLSDNEDIKEEIN